MARKSSISHAVQALFSITGKDISNLLTDFCTIKKLAWSPDVKVAMSRMPASSIGDAVFLPLEDYPAANLQDILASLLKPIRQHDLFDLADWLRDISSGQVPDYVVEHWSSNRVPKALDDLVKQALGAQEADGDEEGVRVAYKVPARKPALKLVPKKQAPVQEDDEDVITGADRELDGFGVPIKEAAQDAITARGMTDKMRWHRVHRYVKALMSDYGFDFRSSPKREADPAKKGLSRVTYFITSKGSADLRGFIAHMENTFGGNFDSYEEFTETSPRSIKLWFRHA